MSGEESLKEKLAYWRQHGAFAVKIPHNWRDRPSPQRAEQETVAELEAAGVEFERYRG